MPDFPGSLIIATHGAINLCSSPASTVFDLWHISGSNASSSGTWPAANRALYQPFVVDRTVTVTGIGFEVVTQSGNYDVGLYDEWGTKLVGLGSTAVPVAGTAKANIADTELKPGLYYAAMNVDNTTATVVRASAITAIWAQVYGVQQQAVGAVTLPSPATFANPASAYVPNLALWLGTF